MSRRRSWLILAATVVGAATTLVAAAPADRTTAPKPRAGGAVVVAIHLDPPSLNYYLDLGAPFSTSVISDQVLASAYRDVGRSGAFVPDLIDGDPKITRRPFSLTYTIKKDARWSDGVAITARDFVYTWQVLAKSSFKIPDATRAAYGNIVHANVLGAKRVRFVFRHADVEWKQLFAPVLPRHALAGANFDEVWRERIDNPKTGRPIASGPFIFAGRNRGSSLTLARNRNYWGRKARLDRLSFRVILDYSEELRALLDGDVDLIQDLAAPQFERRPPREIRIQQGASNAWEHIDFQLGSKGHPALRQAFVRRAIAYGIDRKALTARLYAELAPGLKTAQSAIFLPFQRQYRPHWEIWGAHPQRSIRLLTSHGCRRGPDRIFSCGGRRLSFRFASTPGAALRERTFDVIRAELARVGIEVVNAFSTRFIGAGLPEGDWDLALFSWLSRIDPPGARSQDVWGCGGEVNYARYCNRTVTNLLLRAAVELTPSRRLPLLNRADAKIARDLPTLPLFVRPGYVMYDRRVRNVAWNPYDVLWNAQDWWIAR